MFIGIRAFRSDGFKQSVLINTKQIKEISFENFDDSLRDCTVNINYIDGTTTCFCIKSAIASDAVDLITSKITTAMADRHEVVWIALGGSLIYKGLYATLPPNTELLLPSRKGTKCITEKEWYQFHEDKEEEK